MYNEHLERTRSLNTWFALPMRFPNLDTLINLFKSFVNPTTIDAETLPDCKVTTVWKPFWGQQEYTPTDRRNPAWVKHDREVSEKKIRAYLQPPFHSCQREKMQKGHGRRTNLLGEKILRKDPMHSHDWAMEKAHCYRKKLYKAADGTDWVLGGRRIAVMGFCEHGLEFEEAPGLAYKSKFFRHFVDQKVTIEMPYIAGTVTGTVKDQREVERKARREAKRKAKKKAEREAKRRAGKRDRLISVNIIGH
ncbi:hypothetical protein EAE96_001229 [Botrytis aclada]|nr:hypothetical protein EAE96_001229 [Botrytis aclada]